MCGKCWTWPAGYRSVTGTARLKGQAALEAIRDLIAGNFALA